MSPTRREFFGNAAALSVLLAGRGLYSGRETLSAKSLNVRDSFPPEHKRSNTDWFKAAKWGVFCHYLVNKELSADEWNRQVDNFDVDNLADQLASAGARYFFLTIGQNSGHFCTPNSTYDSIVGIRPSKCSKRDLISDVSGALASKDIKLIVYLPAGAPAADPIAMNKLKWVWGFEGDWPHAWNTQRTGKRLAEFQKMWESVIREWSLRWGEKVSGWWIDGCYFSDEMYRHPDPPNFQSFAAAMKAGNAKSIVAFNGGVFVDMKLREVVSMTEYEDYTAGEVSKAFPICPGRFVDGAQYQILSYLGKSWGSGEPRFGDEFVIGYTKDVVSKGGVVTWDVPISKTGVIPKAYLTQLKKLRDAV